MSVERESTLVVKKSLPNIYRLSFTQVNSLNFFFLLLNPWMKSYVLAIQIKPLWPHFCTVLFISHNFAKKKFEFFGLHFTLRALIRVKGFMLFFFYCFCVGISSFHHPSSREGRIWKGAWTVSRNTQESSKSNINPLSHNINIKIPQTDLHTFPLRISWEHLITDQGIFSLVIICYFS